MSIRLLVNDYPHRSIALQSEESVLLFHHSINDKNGNESGSYFTDFEGYGGNSDYPQCSVELTDASNADLRDFKSLSSRPCYGCLGLIGLGPDVFICVITAIRQVATVRPGETASRIMSVEFHCLNNPRYDRMLQTEINSYPVSSDGYDQGRSQMPLDEHPCLALRKLLGDGTFYFSGEFDLTSRMQDRSMDSRTLDVTNFDTSFMWNSYMLNPLLQYRSRLSKSERYILDDSRILTCVIRGFVETMTIPRPATKEESATRQVGLPAYLTLISRLSCRRAGTRFNARGIDDDGNVANFVETETIIWNPGHQDFGFAVGFSYTQVRGSVPVFWEQQSTLLPGKQATTITRSAAATQPAFDKHMEGLVDKYGAAHVVNLLSDMKTSEMELTHLYQQHLKNSPLYDQGEQNQDVPGLIHCTNYDFHTQTKTGGYDEAQNIRRFVNSSANSFNYFYMVDDSHHSEKQPTNDPQVITQQKGVFRTNCLDCLDRTNLVQGIFSRMALEHFFDKRHEFVGQEFWMRHQTLWADNGDALSRIYAGTGALKSSFTRSGKMSLAGAFADARKSATRLYINNFADKDRQNTIDVILGRLVGQEPVQLYDPINEYVSAELSKRAQEYTSEKFIDIFVGTLNLNGKEDGLRMDLTPWLKPDFIDKTRRRPSLVVVGFQEIVELSPKEIMSTDPVRRQKWETAILRNLNNEGPKDPYVLLRSGQLVGAALMIFARSSKIHYIKNVEGSIQKTGMSGIAGNKGAVAIRFEYANTRLCFITAHLAAGFGNTDERNRDYNTIANGLRFQRDRRIRDHEAVIWLGDFNYRIGLPNERIKQLIDFGDLQSLYDNDQLHLQMVAGMTFPFYNESRITFNPTYKFDVGTDIYDTSEKNRAPAWCDRVLWKGSILEQVSYGSADTVRFSDHRPVFGTFKCKVSLVDEITKDDLSAQIYRQRKDQLRYRTGTGDVYEEDNEDDLLDFEPLAPGLPPPSSEQSKWWLNDGLPVKAALQIPPNSIPNPERTTNPFKESSVPDWIMVEPSTSQQEDSPLKPITRSFTDLSLSSGISSASSASSQRKLPPPYNPNTLPLVGISRASTFGSSPSTPSTPTRKPVPPTQHRVLAPLAPTSMPPPPDSMLFKKSPPRIPQKPSGLLQAPLIPGNPSTDAATDAPPPPPPRRKPVPYERISIPPLPPRTAGAGGIMDSEDAESVSSLSWEPLKPT